MIDVCLLGTGGMMPLPERPLSSLLLRIRGETILFDCGEGTQIAWRRSGWPFRPTGTILLSHLHADHVAGLPGVLFNIAHAGRTEPVTIFGPSRTHEVATNLTSIVGWVPFDLRVVELEGGESVSLADEVQLDTLAVRHRLPCVGYSISISRAPRFDPERATALRVPVVDWKRLQRGEDVGGVRAADVSGPPRRGLKLTVITDTEAFDEIAEFARESDLLVCEAMYADDADAGKAQERGHMTARQAARLAGASPGHRRR
jgi:ribonuclease Z